MIQAVYAENTIICTAINKEKAVSVHENTDGLFSGNSGRQSMSTKGYLTGLFCCLEIVDRLDSAKDFGGRLDVLYDLLHALVSHGGLIEGVGDNAGGGDSCHLGLLLSHGQPLEGGAAGHQTSGTVRCRAVPILVTLANADQGAVTHIDGNQELLAGLGGNSALAEYHLIHINVVVNGLEGL